MPEQFVNPSPLLHVRHYIAFDFPVLPGNAISIPSDYTAAGTLANINLQATAMEQVYGLLGTPPREQGHPLIKENPGEFEDPSPVDQVLDIDQGMAVYHTGRLSGSLVPFLACDQFCSKVVVTALAVAPHHIHENSIQMNTIVRTLEPNPSAPNVWFWRNNDPNTKELLFTATTELSAQRAQQIGFRREQVYKLVFQWQFWQCDKQRNLTKRMPISGFDESIAFEVISATEPL